jgi:hypothetical protein
LVFYQKIGFSLSLTRESSVLAYHFNEGWAGAGCEHIHLCWGLAERRYDILSSAGVQIEHVLEVRVVILVINLITDEGNPVLVSRIWEKITSELQGQLYGDEFHSEDYGTLYRNSITKLLHDKLGAERERLSGKRTLRFDLGKLQKVQQSYNAEIRIKTTLKIVQDEYDRYDSSDSSDNIPDPSDIVGGVKNAENSLENKGLSIVKEEKPLENEVINSDTEPTSSIDLSNLSNLSSSNSDRFKCYHPGCNFHTENEGDYKKHGVQKHPNNPLLYPSKAEIEHYGLEAQGKEWEI